MIADRRRRVDCHRPCSSAVLSVLVHVGQHDATACRGRRPTTATFDLLPRPSCRSIRSTRGPATCWSRCATRTRSRTSSAALQAAGDRDVVVMTVRLLGMRRQRGSGRPDARRRRTSGGCSRRSSRSPSGTAVRCAC